MSTGEQSDNYTLLIYPVCILRNFNTIGSLFTWQTGIHLLHPFPGIFCNLTFTILCKAVLNNQKPDVCRTINYTLLLHTAIPTRDQTQQYKDHAWDCLIMICITPQGHKRSYIWLFCSLAKNYLHYLLSVPLGWPKTFFFFFLNQPVGRKNKQIPTILTPCCVIVFWQLGILHCEHTLISSCSQLAFPKFSNRSCFTEYNW